MQVENIAECSGTTCTKLPPVFKTFVLSIFEWQLQTGFTVHAQMASDLTFGMSLHLCPYFVGMSSGGSNEGDATYQASRLFTF